MLVSISALFTARKLLGWSSKEIAFKGNTLEDLLKTVNASNGTSLFDILAKKQVSRCSKFVLQVNEAIIHGDLQSVRLKPGDLVVIRDNERFHIKIPKNQNNQAA